MTTRESALEAVLKLSVCGYCSHGAGDCICSLMEAALALPSDGPRQCCAKALSIGEWCCYCAEHGCERPEEHRIAAIRPEENRTK